MAVLKCDHGLLCLSAKDAVGNGTGREIAKLCKLCLKIFNARSAHSLFHYNVFVIHKRCEFGPN